MAKGELPRHIGFIPDGNRRWATNRGLSKAEGYAFGIKPGVDLFKQCQLLGIEEITVFCFTQDNVKRAAVQKDAFTRATVDFAQNISGCDAALLVVGDSRSDQFPPELQEFCSRQGSGIKVNLLVNYGWKWDLDGMADGALRSSAISRVDLVVRWGGGRRLSGFLPIQSVYADIYPLDELWPDYVDDHLSQALAWYRHQDRTLGG